MSYNRMFWRDKETVADANKLNNIEKAIEHIGLMLGADSGDSSYYDSYTIEYSNTEPIFIENQVANIATFKVNETFDSVCIASFSLEKNDFLHVSDDITRGYNIKLLIKDQLDNVLKCIKIFSSTLAKDNRISIPNIYIPINSSISELRFSLEFLNTGLNGIQVAQKDSVNIILENLSSLEDVPIALPEAEGNEKVTGDIWFGPDESNNYNPCKNEVFTYDNEHMVIKNGYATTTGKRERQELVINGTAKTRLGNGFQRKFTLPANNGSKFSNIYITEREVNADA